MEPYHALQLLSWICSGWQDWKI